MIILSSYRLGDLYNGYNKETMHTQDIADEILLDFPESIGAEYIKRCRHYQDIDTMVEIVLEFVKKYKDIIPKEVEQSTVIHLRIGDVVAGTTDHEQMKRPLSIDYYKDKLEPNEKIYVIGKCFFARPSSKNYDECIDKSNKYLKEIIDGLNATHYDGGNADVDLCFAVLSKRFFQGRGFYSKLITVIRNKLNLENIETSIIA
jgi:hypothetical protein